MEAQKSLVIHGKKKRIVKEDGNHLLKEVVHCLQFKRERERL